MIHPGRQKPIVLCSLDWIGVGNSSQDRWKAALAKAAGTDPSRVAVHTVHQHDAPGEDATAAELLGIDGIFQSTRVRAARSARVAAAVRNANLAASRTSPPARPESSRLLRTAAFLDQTAKSSLSDTRLAAILRTAPRRMV